MKKLSAKQRAFLAALAKSGNVSVAARLAQVSRSQHYEWLKSNELYAKQSSEAEDEAVELLEAEARRRAYEGVRKPVIYQGELCYRQKWNPETQRMENTGGPLILREYSDVLLIFLLKGLRPQKYRENVNLTGDLTSQIAERLEAGRARLAKEQQ